MWQTEREADKEALSKGLTEDLLEDLGLWEPSNLDSIHVLNPDNSVTWEACLIFTILSFPIRELNHIKEGEPFLL